MYALCAHCSNDIFLVVFHQPFMKSRRKGVGHLLNLGVEPQQIPAEIVPVSK